MDERSLSIIEKNNRTKSSAKRWIWVTFKKAGFHKYPQAETAPELEDVSYLGYKHRHLFHFNIQIEVFHNDRELEFHQVLNFCESLYQDKHLELDYKSVEMMADELYSILAYKYNNRDMKITISEDGECGCTIEYTHD